MRDSGTRAGTGSGWPAAGLAVALALALAILWSWPLIGSAATAIPGEGAGDGVQFLWNLWWARAARAGAGGSLLDSDRMLHPVGVNLALHTHTASYGAAAAGPLARMPLIAALNAIVLAQLALNALAAAWLAWSATRDRAASALAGVVFGGSSFVLAHLRGHFNLLAVWVLPLSLGLARRMRAGSMLAAAALGGTLAIAAWTDYYLTLFSMAAILVLLLCERFAPSLTFHPRARRPRRDLQVVGVLLALDVAAWIAVSVSGGARVRWLGVEISMHGTRNLVSLFWLLVLLALWLWLRPRLRIEPGPALPPRAWRGVGLAALVLLVLTLPLGLAMAELLAAGDYATQAYVWTHAPRGIDAAALVLGQPFHPLWGGAIAALHQRLGIDPIEETAWLGVVPLALLFWGGARLRHDPGARRWLLLGGAGLLWALGPRLRVLGLDTGLWLPQVLARYVPFLANARMPGRAMVLVHLAVAMLAAIAIAQARGGGRPPGSRRVWLLVLVALVDSLGTLALWTPDPPALYRIVRAAGLGGAVCELPLGLADGFGEEGRIERETLYHQTLHGRPMTGGYVSRLSPRTRAAYHDDPLLAHLLALSGGGEGSDLQAPVRPKAPEFGAPARRLGIAWVVLDREASPARLRAFVERDPFLLELARDARRTLYRVRAEPVYSGVTDSVQATDPSARRTSTK